MFAGVADGVIRDLGRWLMITHPQSCGLSGAAARHRQLSQLA
jgi:hypothetical protein